MKYTCKHTLPTKIVVTTICITVSEMVMVLLGQGFSELNPDHFQEKKRDEETK
jgi:hypothetical protein